MINTIKINVSIRVNSNTIKGYRIIKKTYIVVRNMLLIELLNKVYEEFSTEHNTGSGLHVVIFNHCDVFTNDYKFNSLELTNEFDYYLSDTIGDLDNQFNISDKLIVLWPDAPIGGFVEGGVRYFFHMNEKDRHEHTPHIHCNYNGEEISVSLMSEQFKILAGSIKSKPKIRQIKELIRINRIKLLDYWNKVIVKGESIKFNREYLDA